MPPRAFLPENPPRAPASVLAAAVSDRTSRKSVGVDAHIDPAGRTVFTGIFGEFATSQLRNFGNPPGRSVGVDAHIDPAGCTVFTEIFGEFATFQWGDVGIAPYAQSGRFQKSCRGGRLCPPAEKSDFTENYGEYVTSQGRTESSARTKRYEDALGETKLFDEKKRGSL